MHHLKLNIRMLGLAAAIVAVVLAAGSLTPRQTHADYTDPTGVMCGALGPMTMNGNPLPIVGTTLSRVDWDGQNVTITAVAYTAPDTVDMPECDVFQEAIPDDPDVVVPDVQAEVRPSVTNLTFAGNVLGGFGCQEDFTFGGIAMPGWTQVGLSLNLSKTEPTPMSDGAFTFKNSFPTEADCLADTNYTQVIGEINVVISSRYLDGPDEVKGAFNSDWDKDGCLDWVELNPNGPHRDPFVKSASELPCSAVGGIAEAQEVTGGTPLDAAGSSSSNAGLIAGVAAGVAAVVLATGGAAWVTRKRWIN